MPVEPETIDIDIVALLAETPENLGEYVDAWPPAFPVTEPMAVGAAVNPLV
jgi:hypothetical protein